MAKRRRDRSLWHDRELLASKCVVEMVSEDVVVAFAGPADTPVNHTLGAGMYYADVTGARRQRQGLQSGASLQVL